MPCLNVHPRRLAVAIVALLALLAGCSNGSEPAPRATAEPGLPYVSGFEGQPLAVYVRQLDAALEKMGSPLPAETRAELQRALAGPPDEKFVLWVQQLLDPFCVVGLDVNPESRVSVREGPARRQLAHNGWTAFLVKVHNQAGITSGLRVESPEAKPQAGSPAEEVDQRWLELAWFDEKPMNPKLSGLRLEYRILSFYGREPGKRAATMTFDAGEGTRSLGFGSDITMTFDVVQARKVGLRFTEKGGEPVFAGLLIRDGLGRSYPSIQKRLAPDFAFHHQIYRNDGEDITLPDGKYSIRCTRGPEYVPVTRDVTIDAGTKVLSFELERWVDPAAAGWWSGDHHIHAAGCLHYSSPTKGVLAGDIVRHCRGEDLKVACNLTWGPCFSFQSQFFSGSTDPASVYPHLLRYDVEVSGFGSHFSGHICLIGLKQQVPPGGTGTSHWPTLGLKTLEWAKAQGAVCGSAHSGLGLVVTSLDLPNYIIPPFDNIGAHEYIVDITHDVKGPGGAMVPAVDFYATCDTNALAELNLWYHLLNCGFTPAIAGETDFPCLADARIGAGRSYVKVDGTLTVEKWIEGLARGRSYVSEGRSHLMNFMVDGVEVGSGDRFLRLGAAGTVTTQVQVAARLPEEPDLTIDKNPHASPYWHLEKARVGEREVLVELIVNGFPVASRKVPADGVTRAVDFNVPLTHSSWVAYRIFPSSHTNPVFVEIEGKPIRASSRSAQWCLDSVDQCWRQKERFYAAAEKAAATAAYDHARSVFTQIKAETGGRQ